MTLQLPTLLSAAASVTATAMLLRSLSRDYLPYGLHRYLYSKLHSAFSSQITLVIEEFEGLTYNHLFTAAPLYLKPNAAADTNRFRATMPPKHHKISLLIDRNRQITDTFNGAKFTWKLVSRNIPSKYIQTPGAPENFHSTLKSELRFFELRFHRKHRDMVFSDYLPYIMEKAKEEKEKTKTLKLFTLTDRRMRRMRCEMWQGVNLNHPATFETLAMDAEMKEMIIGDLDRFLERKCLYRSVGKAWKRGYLLSGPPGTGKSSLIAAMANYLNFDVYDLELTALGRNSELRNLLIATANRSIIVVEDIDCSLQLKNRLTLSSTTSSITFNRHHHDTHKPQVTLSGFLNFVDGLWSSCGDERIIVFTTNHKDKLDPALLRPGRMDVHIDMSYCTPCGFRMMASNYLGITEHPLFVEVDKLLATTNVTPADVGEQFMKNEQPEIALKSLLELLKEKVRNHESEVLKADVTTQ
ncbi:hypothetical protein RJT34_31881 [Clitoria ternatea]|uniref:AAA+ ATPase domain-containing protein n=1 Tax=Clitoria ternatea TaxID=43366 RepID=A0AAN9EWC2_CLITE